MDVQSSHASVEQLLQPWYF